jgi:hypothetical protein
MSKEQEILKKIRSNKEIKDSYAKFYEITKQSFIDTEKESMNDYALTGFQLRRGYLFKPTAKGDLISQCVKLLGHKYDDAAEIETLALDSVLDNLDNNKKGYTDFLDNLDSYLQTYSYIMPNYLFNFDDDVRIISIGKVEAIRGEDIITSLKKFPPQRRLHLKLEMIQK